MFPTLTVDTAPERIRPTLRAIQGDAPTLPDAVARIAHSPENLRAFLAAHAQFEHSSLQPLEREIVTLVVAQTNGCRVCVAMHEPLLDRLAADDGATSRTLAEDAALHDEQLEALRRFTLAVLKTRGAVGPDALADLLAHGYSARTALDVALGVGAYTISTYTNRLIESAGT